MIAALARPPLARLTRRPRSVVTLAGWSLFALALAVAARVGGSSRGADHVLVGAFGGLALPLLAYAVVGAVVAGGSLSGSTAGVVAFGASPVRAAALTVATAVTSSTLLAALVAAAVAVAAHGAADPSPAVDAAASAYAGALGGGAYAAWFCLGATLGRRGGGRTAFLVADWIVGVGIGPLALLVPRAHVRCLLGGACPVELSGRASSVVLAGLGVACALLASWRGRGVR